MEIINFAFRLNDLPEGEAMGLSEPSIPRKCSSPMLIALLLLPTLQNSAAINEFLELEKGRLMSALKIAIMILCPHGFPLSRPGLQL